MRWGWGSEIRMGVFQVFKRLAITFLLILCSGAVFANPCDQDFDRLCQGTTEKDAGKCLNKNIDKVSSECSTFAMEMREQRKNLKIACYGDIKNLCKDITPGDSRVFNCLNKNEKYISVRCKVEMAKILRSYNY